MSDYEQTLLFVSHDRYFIDKFATRIWELRDGVITDFRGSYKEFCEWRSRQQVFAQNDKQREKEKKPKVQKSKNNEKSLARLEKDIARLEAQIKDLDREAEEFAADYQKLMDIHAQREELDLQLLQLYENWEELNA